MGKYEEQLKALGTSDAVWRIEGITRLESQMAKLKADMTKLAADPGWTGTSAEAAKELFASLQAEFLKGEEKLNTVRSALGKANGFRADAAGAQSSLPDAQVPDWIHNAALVGGGIMVPVPGIGTFAAEFVVQRVNDFMGLQREAAAQKALEDLETNLAAPKAEIQANAIAPVFGGPLKEWPEEAETPDWPGAGVVYDGDDNGNGGWSTKPKPSYGGGGGPVTETGFVITDPGPTIRTPEVVVYPPNPPVVLPPVRPPGWPEDFIKPPEISIDGNTGGGSNPGGFLGGGGGLGAGLAGAGVAAGGLGAAKLASKAGLGGANGLFGTNGLLGGGAAGGANGAGSSGAGGKAGTGAAAGGAGAKGGTNAMMGGGGQGGSSEKNKRSSLGLMAPKLEDDEENGPRSAAAGAGGRE